MLLPFITEDI